MWQLKCMQCGKDVSTQMPDAVKVKCWVQCGECIRKEVVSKIEALNSLVEETIGRTWHLGVFDDIGIDSGIDGPNRLRVVELTQRLHDIIPDSDMSEKFVDIGCNCGQFLRHLWIRGARDLTGIEPRAEHLDFAQQWVRKYDADIKWRNKVLADVSPGELDDSIVLCLGLIYHLAEPDSFFEILKKSKFKYCILESQVFEKETTRDEKAAYTPQNASEDGAVWQPTIEAVEEMCAKRGFTYERLDYTPNGMMRGLWKVERNILD